MRMRIAKEVFSQPTCGAEGFVFALKFPIQLPEDVSITALGAQPTYMSPGRTIVTFKKGENLISAFLKIRIQILYHFSKYFFKSVVFAIG